MCKNVTLSVDDYISLPDLGIVRVGDIERVGDDKTIVRLDRAHAPSISIEIGHAPKGADEAEPVAYAIYGRVTGALRKVVDEVEDGDYEFYDVVPLYPHPGTKEADRG